MSTLALPLGDVNAVITSYNDGHGLSPMRVAGPNEVRIEASSDRHRISQRLIELRALLGDTQQQFANRLGTAVTTIARYETSRPPKGRVLALLEQIARAEGHSACADAFRTALEQELGISVSGSGKHVRHRSQVPVRRNPWHLYTRDELTAAYDNHVAIANNEGHTVEAIRIEFERENGSVETIDVAPPHLQSVTKKGRTYKKRVTRIAGPAFQIRG